MSPASVQPYHLQPDILEVMCMYILICAGSVPEGTICVCVFLFLIKGGISAFWVGEEQIQKELIKWKEKGVKDVDI